MKQWWQELNVREQKLVAVMATVIGIFLLYSIIWQPLNENLAKSTKKLARQQALLTWVNNNTARYQQVNTSGNTKSRGSISSVVNRTASNYRITVTRMQPQGNELQVWIDEVAFKDLLKWLDQLSISEGLQVKGIDLTRGEQPGVVRVRRLQLGKN
jgi:general secretion pathway protein M|tara:strand:- start:56 stop:523 length:468 start_codon:yes stop_codon:yes gene_type:complete